MAIAHDMSGDNKVELKGPARTQSLELVERKLARLVQNGLLLSREKDRAVLLKEILAGARDISHCAAATLFLRSERDTLVIAMRTNEWPLPITEIPLFNADGSPNHEFVVCCAALHNETILIDDVYAETRFDLSGTKRFSEESGFRTISMLVTPLSPRDGEVTGVLQLLNALDPETGAVTAFPPELIGFIEAVASQAAVALENQSLLDAQEALFEALLRLIAGAVDAKSPYTGGHCERVPELALMLAEEVARVTSGPLAGHGFETEAQWREFRVGAWLHDCGKVTTPEFVVDKATKLETIHNRINEVRLRFEVLLRDARIERLTAVMAGADPAEADRALAARHRQLTDDFAFLAECNIGGEFMAPEKVARVRQIGEQTWMRHFDDRLGLSHEELLRFGSEPPSPTPAAEPLLADKPQHLVCRPSRESPYKKHDFRVNAPEHLYNFGEVHNLSISRGTINAEERFKINEHIMQTIVMLETLPLPKHLRRVPEYAGTHHETLTGEGYPRGLTAAELSVPARIMAIADIFEALTAADRPYKRAKTLSESVKILWRFKMDGHIDPDLFDLFLTSGLYRRYGERFLRPEQLDEVDIGGFVSERKRHPGGITWMAIICARSYT
jgi:HD-GYP domain-containing protein (c-di-GMP phosphodiesterase class II)